MPEVNHVHPLVSARPAPPTKSVTSHNASSRLAAMTGRAMRPPSLSPSFHILLPLNIFPRNKITGKASMGKRMMYGANSSAGVVAIGSKASDPAIVPPQFLRTLTSSSVIDSCCPYMARKMANPMATSLAAMAMAKMV